LLSTGNVKSYQRYDFYPIQTNLSGDGFTGRSEAKKTGFSFEHSKNAIPTMSLSFPFRFQWPR